MKKYGTLIALAVAVLFGIIAVVLANKWLTTRTPEETVIVKESVPLTKIVIANKDLNIGSKLSNDNLTLADWPKANMPKGAFNKVEDVIDRVVVTQVIAGTPIVAAELAAPGSGAGLVAKIKPGKRAMAIKVNEVIGVGGFILPNTFVDVISVEGKTNRARTILERVEVLAVAQETFVEEGQAKLVKTVTMELSPRQAEKLAETTHTGAIHLVLRNPAEDEMKKPEPPPEVKPKPRPKVVKRVVKPRPKPPETYDIIVIKGTKSVDEVKLPADN